MRKLLKANAAKQLARSFVMNCVLLGALTLLCIIAAPVYGQVDQRCVQKCESGNCVSGDMSPQRLQQCRAACVKNCTRVSPPGSQDKSAATPASAQAIGYMKITSVRGRITGESNERYHPGWIELHEMTYPANTGGMIVVTKAVDISSSALQRASATGEHLKEVVIDVYRSGRLAQRFTLSNVLISSMQASRGDHPMERLSLNFGNIQYIEY